MIKPIVLNKYPDLRQKYDRYVESITDLNDLISVSIDEWFDNRKLIEEEELNIKGIGDEENIESIVKRLKNEIGKKQKEADLSPYEISKYEEITRIIKENTESLNDLKSEYISIVETYTEETNDQGIKIKKFDIDITLKPEIEKLPDLLKTSIYEIINARTESIPIEVSTKILDYLKANLLEQITLVLSLYTITKDNESLLDKAKATVELQELIAEKDKQELKLDKIKKIKKLIKEKKTSLRSINKDIKKKLEKRESLNQSLLDTFKEIDQESESIRFNIDMDFEIDDLSDVLDRINKQEASDFISTDGDTKSLDINEVRNRSAELLEKLYTGEQKTKAGNSPFDVAKQLLSLSKSVRFMAKMEGDSIGGFSKSTMTEGKQALFALTLILSEDDDSWPLLIDQPEDDLDSWSIYESIVPFLKDQKKKRQIFMVSHNANLVIGADSEQILVANQHGDNRKNKDDQLFDYLSGALEDSQPRDKSEELILLSRGVKEHACDILDGGEVAFEKRMNKYNIKK